MNLNALTSCIIFVVRFRYIIGIGLGLILLAVGGAFGWRYYQYRTSPVHTLENFNVALTKKDMPKLAMLVDFRSLSLDLADAMAAVYPSEKENAARLHMADAIQLQLIKSLEDAKADKTPPPPAPNAPVAPLPTDFIAQLINKKFTLVRSLEDAAVIQVTVDHPQAERNFLLMLHMSKDAEGNWRVSKLANARELVESFKAAQLKVQAERDAAFAEKNDELQHRMDGQLPISSCTVSAGVLSDKQTVLMVIAVMGRNAGPHNIHSLNLIATVANRAGKVLYEKHLNTAQRSMTGDEFSHSWTVQMDVSDPLVKTLLAEPKLQCSTRLWTMVLGSGEVLHIKEK